MFLNIQID